MRIASQTDLGVITGLVPGNGRYQDQIGAVALSQIAVKSWSKSVGRLSWKTNCVAPLTPAGSAK
jgi:hypothetical protein